MIIHTYMAMYNNIDINVSRADPETRKFHGGSGIVFILKTTDRYYIVSISVLKTKLPKL